MWKEMAGVMAEAAQASRSGRNCCDLPQGLIFSASGD